MANKIVSSPKMEYRSRQEIHEDILRDCAMGDKTLTRLMYNSYTSYSQITKYVEDMTEHKVIQKVANAYRITEKGKTYLEALVNARNCY